LGRRLLSALFLAAHSASGADDRGSWTIDRQVASRYLAVCAAASLGDDEFSSFRSQPDYQRILEHVSPLQGLAYLKHILEGGPALLAKPAWDEISRSDALGRPPLQAYPGLGETSPTLLRYASTLVDVRRAFRTTPDSAPAGVLDPPGFAGWRVCEIGGGYGGLAHVFLAAARAMGSAPPFYRLFDLPEPTALQRRFLNELGWEGSFEVSTLEEEESAPAAACDLVISNYALSELDEPTQLRYSRALLERARRGVFLTINAFDDSGGSAVLASLSSAGLTLRVEPETPPTNLPTEAPAKVVIGTRPHNTAPPVQPARPRARARARSFSERLQPTVVAGDS